MSEPPVTHEVGDADWLLRIAHGHNLRTEECLWSANPELKQLTINPNVLPQGFRLKIPAPKPAVKPAQPESVNRYVAPSPSVLVRLQVSYLRDSNESGFRNWARGVGEYDEAGTSRRAWFHYTLIASGQSTRCLSEPAQTPIPSGGNLGQPPVTLTLFQEKGLPDAVTTVGLVVQVSHPVPRLDPTGATSSGWTRQQDVEIRIGSLEPIRGPRAVHAIQKILTNLGYYAGEIDGSLSPRTRAALRHFQEAEGIRTPGDGAADQETCSALSRLAGPQVSFAEADPTAFYPAERDVPLSGLTGPGRSQSANLYFNSSYNEPAQPDRCHRRPLGNFPLFNPTAYVAPAPRSSTPGTGIATNLRQRRRQFVFLDVGHWLKDAREFGVVWGRHVYLCRFHHLPGCPLTYGQTSSRLDRIFFDAMGARVEIVQGATASWAPEDELDWDHLHLVFPDLHLLTDPVERLWRGRSYHMQAELDLLHFAHDLQQLESLKGKVRVVQVGDSFDLWVSRRCVFKDDPGHNVVLMAPEDFPVDPNSAYVWEGTVRYPKPPDPVDLIRSWVRELQGWVGPKDAYFDGLTYEYLHRQQNWVLDVFEERFKNGIDTADDFHTYGTWLRQPSHPYGAGYQVWLSPAEKAFQLFEQMLGNDMVYLWGNHDNYLGLPNVAQAAGLRPRKLFYETRGLYIEHAHRMEAFFTFGANYDGTTSGHQATDEVYRARCGRDCKADKIWAALVVICPELALISTPGTIANEVDELSEVWAGFHDQYGYWSELARLRLGREMNGGIVPHICVIGHTHRPRLEYIDINRDT